MTVDLYNLENKVVGKTELPEKVFGEHWRPALVAQVLNAQLANKRNPWAHAKTRAEVSGGGRKPWRQKGTGRARHGSTRSPIWRHGGKAHGPLKTRDYSQKVNKKMKKRALFSVFSRKLKDGEVKIFDSLDIEAGKTKILSGKLAGVLGMGKKSKKYDALLVVGAENKNTVRASSNLLKTKSTKAGSLNLYDAMNYKNVFIDKVAVKEIEQHYKT